MPYECLNKTDSLEKLLVASFCHLQIPIGQLYRYKDSVSVGSGDFEFGEDFAREVEIGSLGAHGEDQGTEAVDGDGVSLARPHGEGGVQAGRLAQQVEDHWLAVRCEPGTDLEKR